MFYKFKVVVVYVIIELLSEILTMTIIEPIAKDGLTARLIGIMITCASIIFWHYRYDKPIFDFKRINWRNSLSAIGIGIVGHITVSISVNFLPDVVVKNQESIEGLIRTAPVMSAILLIVIVAPLFEELVFRHLFLNVLFKKHKWIGILCSSVLFALAHSASTITEFVIYGIPGVVLAIICWKKGLENAMLWHMLMNAIGLAAILI